MSTPFAWSATSELRFIGLMVRVRYPFDGGTERTLKSYTLYAATVCCCLYSDCPSLFRSSCLGFMPFSRVLCTSTSSNGNLDRLAVLKLVSWCVERQAPSDLTQTLLVQKPSLSQQERRYWPYESPVFGRSDEKCCFLCSSYRRHIAFCFVPVSRQPVKKAI